VFFEEGTDEVGLLGVDELGEFDGGVSAGEDADDAAVCGDDGAAAVAGIGTDVELEDFAAVGDAVEGADGAFDVGGAEVGVDGVADHDDFFELAAFGAAADGEDFVVLELDLEEGDIGDFLGGEDGGGVVAFVCLELDDGDGVLAFEVVFNDVAVGEDEAGADEGAAAVAEELLFFAVDLEDFDDGFFPEGGFVCEGAAGDVCGIGADGGLAFKGDVAAELGREDAFDLVGGGGDGEGAADDAVVPPELEELELAGFEAACLDAEGGEDGAEATADGVVFIMKLPVGGDGLLGHDVAEDVPLALGVGGGVCGGQGVGPCEQQGEDEGDEGGRVQA